MTDNRFIDIESLEGQAELIARTRRAVDEIGEVQACSPDDLVRVTVAVSGLVTDVDLADETVRLDREELDGQPSSKRDTLGLVARERTYSARDLG